MVTDEQLIADYTRGQSAAFAELVKRYQSELFAFLQRFVNDPAIAEDIFQETFIQIHRNAASFDPQRRFRPWLFTIAANKARDYLRSSGRRNAQSLDNIANQQDDTPFVDLLASDAPPPPETLSTAEDIARVQEVLADLPPLHREAILMAHFHRFAYKQMAEMLGIPLGTVKSRLHAALAQFARTYRARYGKP